MSQYPADLFDSTIGLFRADHQETSRAAAIDVYPRSGTQRFKVVECIRQGGPDGRTRDEIAEILAMSPNTVRPRVKELLDAGWVKPSGKTRPTPMGHKSEVLIFTPKEDR